MENINFELFLIRHGESEANCTPHLISGRSSEAELTQTGHLQAIKLGQRLQNEGVKFDAVFSSPLVRARRTCDLAVESTGFLLDEVIEAEELIEMTQGDWEGQVRADVYTPKVLVAMNSQGKFFKPPQGEAQRMIERRYSNWLEDTVLYNERYYDGVFRRFAVFGHCQGIRVLLHYVMGFNDRLIHRLELGNTSINKLYFDKSGWGIRSINDTAHLYESTANSNRILKGGETNE